MTTLTNKKIHFFAIALLGLYSCNVLSIQRSTALVGTGLFGGAIALGEYNFISNNSNFEYPVLLCAAGAGLTAFVYHQLSTITPEGRLKRANKILKELSRHSLIVNDLREDKAFFDCVYDIYLTEDLPLISAYNYLVSELPMVHSALGLINKASAQVYDANLKEECDCSLVQAQRIFHNISEGIKRIREHKDYLEQLRIYKQYLADQKQQQINNQIAVAQAEMASAQKSATLLKWLKAIFFGK